MIGLAFHNSRHEADIATTSTGALEQCDPLFTSALVSLFTRRQVDDLGAELPNVAQGWYGDTFRPRPLGSRLWTLRDGKLDATTLRLAQAYAYEALSWWLTKRIVRTLMITTRERDSSSFSLHIEATRPDGTRWNHVWEGVSLYAL